jgi:chaperonin GroES
MIISRSIIKENKMSNESIRPLHDRVVIKPLEAKKTAGGILIPETAGGEKPQRGLIKAVGPGKLDNGVIHPLEVKVGDTVLFGKYAGTEVKVDGEELLVMREEDIMGIIA